MKNTPTHKSNSLATLSFKPSPVAKHLLFFHRTRYFEYFTGQKPYTQIDYT
jgi:hypothetical protein